MAPYLQSVTSFTDVPVTEEGVDTLKFLEAADGLAGLFDILNTTAFSIVEKDIKGNIEKVRARYETNTAESSTLELLVENEQGEKKRTATEGLMWLLRGFSFTSQALKISQTEKNKELEYAFSTAYGNTLKKFHTFFVKGLFQVAMKSCPYRAVFYGKLKTDPNGGDSATDEELNTSLDAWLVALDAIVKRMETFYEKNNYHKGF